MADSEFINSLTIDSSNKEKTRKDTITDLLRRRAVINNDIEDLEAKLKALKTEKLSITDKFKTLGYIETLPSLKLGTPTVTKLSEPREKANFLYDLFQGRRDVFPMRVYSKKTKSINYYPQCSNFYMPGCPRLDKTSANIQCKDCPVKAFKPVTPETIYHHQLNNDNKDDLGAMGIYVMRKDNTCYLVVIDMDEKSYMEDAKAVLTIARNRGFSMCIERSRSGKGAHLWIFFSEPVEARYARRLAFSFLEEAAESGNIKAHLASYDRIFPTQDTLHENGFGNLILMPLIKSAARRKCTLFMEDDLESTYPDQLAYLSSVRRHSREDVLTYLDSIATSDDDNFSLSSGEDPEMLWKRELPKLEDKDFRKTLVLYLSAGITLDKSALSDRALYYFKKLASFSNPDYYKHIVRYDGYVSRDIPYTIYTHEETESALLLPRAFLDYITAMLNRKNIPFKIEDHRIRNTGLEAEFNGTLKPEQIEPYNKLLRKDNGILKAATAFGKTITAIALIAANKERTLILVEKSDLVGQWKSKLEKFLIVHNEYKRRKYKRYDDSPFGTLQGPSDNLKGLVDIVMMQSLYSKLKNHTMPEGFLNNYGMVIVDECHHFAADTFCSLTKDLPAAKFFGLTATEKREDGKEKIIYAHIGKVIEAVDAATLAYRRNIQQFFIPHFTDTTLPSDSSKISWNELIDFLSENEERNRIILDDIESEQKKGRHILVITKRTDHVDYLSSHLKERGIDVLSLYGKMKKKDKDVILDRIRSEEAIRNNTVLVATSNFIEEGSDIPHLDTLFITMPLSAEKGIIQVAGRIGRAYEGKTETNIHDYVDIGIPQSEATYNKRVRIYGNLGYLPRGNYEIPEEEILYTADNAIEAIASAIERARKSIIISVPYITPTRNTERIFETLYRKADISISIVTRRNTSERYVDINRIIDESLRKLNNLKRRETDNSNPIMLLVDNDEVWYGDLNYMAIKSNTEAIEGTLMHIRNSKLVARMKSIPLFW